MLTNEPGRAPDELHLGLVQVALVDPVQPLHVGVPLLLDLDISKEKNNFPRLSDNILKLIFMPFPVLKCGK